MRIRHIFPIRPHLYRHDDRFTERPGSKPVGESGGFRVTRKAVASLVATAYSFYVYRQVEGEPDVVGGD